MNTDTNYASAEAAVALLHAWQTLKQEQGLSGNQAARVLKRPPSLFCRWNQRYQREGTAGLLRPSREPGAARKLFRDLPAWFLPVAKFFFLNTNLCRNRGSIPEAIRRTILLPKCPPAVQIRIAAVCAAAGWQPVNGERLPTLPARSPRARPRQDCATQTAVAGKPYKSNHHRRSLRHAPSQPA